MLHFASFAATLAYIGISLVVYFACGYTLLNRILRVNLHKTYGLMISLPIYLSVGIVFLTFILYGIGMIILNGLVADFVTMAVLVLFLADMLLTFRKSTASREHTESKDPHQSGLRRTDEVLAALVIGIGLLYVATIIFLFEWPPYGDVVTHGFLTSLIVYDQRIPTTLSPLLSAGIHYPLGLHASATFLALLLGIYPGEAVFLFGGVLMIVITSLIFSLTYTLTGSKVLSLLPYVSSYLVFSVGGGGGDLEWWLFGYLFNGPYPNLYAFLIMLLSMTAIVIFVKMKDEYVLTRLFPIFIIVSLLVYPNLVLFTLLLFIFAVIQSGGKNAIHECFKTRNDTLVTVALAFSLIYFSWGAYLPTLTAVTGSGGLFSAYAVSSKYILNSSFGFSIFIALVVSLILLFVNSKHAGKYYIDSRESSELIAFRPIFLTFVVTVLVLYLSLSAEFYAWLQYLLPSRLMTTTLLISVVLNVYGLNRLLKIMQKKPPSSAKKKSIDKRNKALVFAVVLILFNYNGLMAYSLASHASLSLASGYGTFSQSTFKPNFEAIEWITRNVGEKELILNDWSFSGLYLISLSIKNVSMNPELAGSNRAVDLQEIWLHPGNMTLVLSLLNEYNVTYVLVTSELDYINISVSSWIYQPKPYLPSQYITIFTGYPFFELVYNSGSAAVFKVK